MKTVQNNGYTEIILGSNDLEDFVIDEVFLKEIEQENNALVVNIKRFACMGSAEIMNLIKWLTQIDTVSGTRTIVLANEFVGQVILRILEGAVAVFTNRGEMDVALKQEVGLQEKELLWL